MARKGSYKNITYTADISGLVSEGFSELEELGTECQEIVDNASEGLAQTQRIQTLESTAGELGSLSEPTVPDFAELFTGQVTVSENRSKRKGCSRQVRCQNAISKLNSAKEIAEYKVLDLQASLDKDDTDEAEEISADDERRENRDALEELINELDEIISTAENCEFPGMFG